MHGSRVADLLRGDFKQSECGKVILPFTVLRRLDCMLEPTKPAVLRPISARTCGSTKGARGRPHPRGRSGGGRSGAGRSGRSIASSGRVRRASASSGVRSLSQKNACPASVT